MKIFQNLRSYLTEHLRDANWTYWQHLSHALVQVRKLIVITFKGLVHGFIPWVWPGAAPVGIYQLYKEMRNLRHVQPRYEADDLADAARLNKSKNKSD
jgi:hypothetical protein